MKIRLELHTSAPADRRWAAIDDDDYDGAPDTPWYGKLVGWGYTAAMAEADLMDLKADARASELQVKQADDSMRDRDYGDEDDGREP